MTILVTGGAGFIGANFVLDWLGSEAEPAINLDKLTYAGSLDNLASLEDDPRHLFVRGDIADRALVSSLLATHRPRAIVHFAAESHVDRSIAGPDAFIQTNAVGTHVLLEAARSFWTGLPSGEKEAFRFLHVSTDEVYGSLGPGEEPIAEGAPYRPNSPYSASKAASDHFARAYFRTYGLPVLTTHCSNNYGPLQFPEKLIPVIIRNALAASPVPIYGDGRNMRDWLYVGDHCSALRAVLARGRVGETYNISGDNEAANIDLARTICALLDEMLDRPGSGRHARLITSVPDRPGHDFRYAISSAKLKSETGWRPSENFETGLRKTVAWYLDNQDWVKARLGSGA